MSSTFDSTSRRSDRNVGRAEPLERKIRVETAQIHQLGSARFISRGAVGIDELPHDLSLWSDLEGPTATALDDQGVPVFQSIGCADILRAKFSELIARIGPYLAAGYGI